MYQNYFLELLISLHFKNLPAIFTTQNLEAQSAGAVEHTDCISAER